MTAPVLQIIASLTKTLSHKIRTPLSVISNELHYLGTKTSKEDVEIASAQCRKISEILSASTLLETKLSLTRFALSDLFKGEISDSQVFNIEGDKEKLLKAFDLVAQILEEPVETKLRIEEKEIIITYAAPPSISPNSTGTYESLSALFLNNLDLNSIGPPLFDTIILGHGWKIASKLSSGRIEITLSLPKNG